MNLKIAKSILLRPVYIIAILSLMVTNGLPILRAAAQGENLRIENNNEDANQTGALEVLAEIRDGTGNATAVDWTIPNPRMVVFPEWEWFDGLDWPDGTVTVSVEGKSECTVEKESSGGFFNGNFGEGCNLEIGDTVNFTDGTTFRTHTVQNLAVTTVNAESNIVAGTADEGAEVFVWPHATGEQLSSTADSSGIWQVDFTGTYDLVPGEGGRSEIRDETGNATAVDWSTPKPYLIAFPENEAVEGWEWPAGATVTLTIDHAPGLSWEGTALVTDWGDPRTYIRFDFAGEYDLAAGDVVTLTSPGVIGPVSHTVQNLAVTGSNAASETVSGTADVGSVVQVWAHGFDPGTTAVSDEDGNWLADFYDIGFDLMPGMSGRSQFLDEFGNATAVDWTIPNPRITVSITDDWFRIEEFPRETLLTLSIYASMGGELLWQDTRPTDENGFVFVGGWEFELDLTAGMYLEVSSGAAGVSKAILLEPVLLFVFDSEADLLAGKAPADRHVWVGTGNDSSGCSMDVESDSEGIWGADFSAQPCDVTSDMWAAAQVFDEDGDATEANPGFPRGWHDYDTGDVPSWACNAGGWALDPDDQGRAVAIRILSDGVVVDELTTGGAGDFGYQAHLWEVISSYETHEITVEAYDEESLTWRTLEGTPRDLTCRTYDIYAYDPLTGETRQITNMQDADEFNPSWSQNGKLIAHDATFGDERDGIYITDVDSGVSTPLLGAENGNDAVWSPNGKWIAFDRAEEGIYIVPSSGGEATLVKEYAVSAGWAPNGRRLVFQLLDGSIWTAPVDHGKGPDTLIAASGANPVWSPDGGWIAYEDAGDIWKVPVNVLGVVLGEPIQVTSLAAWEGQPTWSMDSQTIVYHAGLSRDFDLWSVPAAGGEPTWLTGAPEFGDYDPAYAWNSFNIAYASFSPNGQASRTWVAAFTHNLPADYWTEGAHTYQFSAEGSLSGDLREFEVSTENQVYDGTVLLRPGGIRAFTGEGCTFIEGIHPSQPTQFHLGWTADGTYSEARAYYAGLMAQVVWDSESAVDLDRHEIFPFTSQVDWQGYVCTYTSP